VSRLADALRRVAVELQTRRVPFALVGGLAVSTRVEPRFTRDVDLCVAVDDDAEAEELVRSLCGDDYEVLAQVEHEATGRLATVRVIAHGAHGADPVVDLLFASSGIEPEIVARAEEIDVLGGLRLRVATLADLVALKVLARDDATRPQDRVDLIRMLSQASPTDVEQAREALGLIAARGCHRNRDLDACLDQVLSELDAG